jgi:hypothetical protein
MASCNNSYLSTGIDLSVLQLLKAGTEKIINCLQVLQEGEAFKLSAIIAYRRKKRLVYLFDPAAPCSYWSPVSAAPAVPFAIPLLLAISRASSGFVPV